MQPYQARVVIEKEELDAKISKLNDFLAVSPIVDTLLDDEKGRLLQQLDVMRQYSSILHSRISAFGK